MRKNNNSGWIIQLAVYAAFFAVALGIDFGLGQTGSKSEAVITAENFGLEQVAVTGEHRFLVQFHGCGKYDVAGFNVTGTNANGRTVEAVVCQGIFKKGTVRS